MLTNRIIPVLLLKDWGIVKTVRFKKETYIGCPINAVRVFNAMHADELFLLDIRATSQGRPPITDIALQVTEEATMPITVGGGLRTVEDIREILRCGADKVSINTCAVEQPELIRQAAGRFGSQCIVISIDYRRSWRGKHQVFVRRGTKSAGLHPVDHAKRVEALGAGEILLNSIDRDGTWGGFELDMLRAVADAVKIPVVACGGAGRLEHFRDALDEGRASAVAAGSFFLFHGRRRGILINFPTRNSLGDVLGPRRVRVPGESESLVVE